MSDDRIDARQLAKAQAILDQLQSLLVKRTGPMCDLYPVDNDWFKAANPMIEVLIHPQSGQVTIRPGIVAERTVSMQQGDRLGVGPTATLLKHVDSIVEVAKALGWVRPPDIPSKTTPTT